MSYAMIAFNENQSLKVPKIYTKLGVYVLHVHPLRHSLKILTGPTRWHPSMRKRADKNNQKVAETD